MKFFIATFFLLVSTCFSSSINWMQVNDTTVNSGNYSDSSSINSITNSANSIDTSINTSHHNNDSLFTLMGLDDNSLYIDRINHENILTEDYRNLSDIFTYAPFGFLQDMGAFGQPNEQMFYGLGFGNISYSRDGVLLNNRFLNSYNLNKLSVEPIDSVELAPITKGFLYSIYSNPISVSMNSRYKFPNRPVTYLKFYQGSYDEGFVDVLFHAPITQKLNFGVDISNSAIDSRFSNSDYESWKLNAQVNYLVNEHMNIHANYFFSYDTLALFGGLDSNTMINDNFSTVLYPYDSYSRSSSRYQLTYNNHATLKVIASYFPNTKTDLTIYLNSISQKFRQNVDSTFTNLPSYSHDNNQFSFGASLRNYYDDSNFSLDIIANYESSNFKSDLFASNFNQNIFTISGDVKLLNSFKYFTPSLFGKFSDFAGSSLLGYGINLSGTIFNGISYFAGISKFQQQVSPIENFTGNGFDNNLISQFYRPLTPSDNKSFEIGVKYRSPSFSGKFSYFNYSASNKAIPKIIQLGDSLLINEASYFQGEEIKNSGVNLNFDLRIWKFLFSNNLSYYFTNAEDRKYSSPKFTLAGKIYYLDLLFNNNLNLKTGINYRFVSSQNPFVYDFEKSVQISEGLTPLVSYAETSTDFQMDLFMAGTIQERATIFITLENLFNSQYYIVPYYFKQALTLRFGVSWILFD